jgi:hypothetical protein
MYSGIDTKGLNKIYPEINYLKDERLKELQGKHKIFASLLEQRKKIKKPKG